MSPVFDIDAFFQEFAARGIPRVRGDQPFDPTRPLHPLNPWQRRPMPQRPFRVPAAAVQAIRDPAADVFAEDETVTVYVDLPGETSSDIQLNITNGVVEVKAKHYYKLIRIPSDLLVEAASSKYRNGVLTITVPRRCDARESARRIPIA
jgi:HSP20 family molecular chaperone IbpA